jgi:hypothetical protein
LNSSQRQDGATGSDAGSAREEIATRSGFPRGNIGRSIVMVLLTGLAF